MYGTVTLAYFYCRGKSSVLHTFPRVPDQFGVWLSLSNSAGKKYDPTPSHLDVRETTPAISSMVGSSNIGGVNALC